MQIPFFYSEHLATAGDTIVLPEESSKHIVSVLRMKPGEPLHLVDGKGNTALTEIIDDHKKKCVVTIISVEQQTRSAIQNTIAISLLKNSHRFEWFLEKATELGIAQIVPLICERTERQHYRKERMEGILISAMLQSRQSWMPLLTEPMKFTEYLLSTSIASNRMLAHCENGPKQTISSLKRSLQPNTILIGPEGDFTAAEINMAIGQGFSAVSLGNTRLRSETAGMVAATLLMTE